MVEKKIFGVNNFLKANQTKKHYMGYRKEA